MKPAFARRGALDGAARMARARGGFEAAQRLAADDMASVDAVVLRELRSDIALIPELARHLIAAGGKRVRPLLTLLACRACGGEIARAVPLAACVEFIHTATLLHDDVVDESDLRRGRDSANAVWGNKAPVLVGDFLFSRAFQLMVADGDLEVLRILSAASATIVEGEVAQLVTANDLDTDEAAYLRVIEGKTAALFRAACEIGPVIADRSGSMQRAMADFGSHLGVAFQLIDDALDYDANQEALGKAIGDDFRDGKITLPVILAFAAGDEEERAFWRRALESLDQRPGDVATAGALLAKHGAVEKTVARAEAYAAKARRALASAPDGAARDGLEAILDFCVARAH